MVLTNQIPFVTYAFLKNQSQAHEYSWLYSDVSIQTYMKKFIQIIRTS